MGVTFSQFFPPHPTLTEANLPSQKGKVFIVTGGASGVGFELCTILYQAGGKVYLAGRSEVNAQSAISKIKALPTTSPGELVFLPLSLDDLTTIKPAVEAFTALESKLDVLFNNAGVSLPPRGSVSAQGHELQMATNCLGHYLLTQLLLPTLLRTAKTAPPAAVRVIWTSSIVVDLTAPKYGIDISDLTNPPPDQQKNYLTTKIGNWFLASALAAQVGSEGILSVTQNPGNLKTSLLRHAPWILGFVSAPLLYSAKMGAYTELWSGLSEELGIEDGGKYVLPWGRVHPSPMPDLLAAMKTKEDGGTGVAALFVDYCENQTAEFR
jgi:NAD(P)-dependent dehydrogenase (short-subunit alcohol dehydrogenase family)